MPIPSLIIDHHYTSLHSRIPFFNALAGPAMGPLFFSGLQRPVVIHTGSAVNECERYCKVVGAGMVSDIWVQRPECCVGCSFGSSAHLASEIFPIHRRFKIRGQTLLANLRFQACLLGATKYYVDCGGDY
ncbi:hypothetical protein FIBSPDRAFT_902427 [Athelia psychrophila]|uniref:Uncharacterized protein n=1 Tax=Athelia psychrophila TaxID=1759441 RepID=A0A167X8Z2_9AGAM|nr:hypothetical protein FIBSPDRAFT_902427 [Fibularhizoctonia sp. CBS 109695]